MIDEYRKCIICGEDSGSIYVPTPSAQIRCAKCSESNDLWIEPIPMADWEGDMDNHPAHPPLDFSGISDMFYLGTAHTIVGVSKSTFPYVTGSGVPAYTGTFYIAGTGTFFQ